MKLLLPRNTSCICLCFSFVNVALKSITKNGENTRKNFNKSITNKITHISSFWRKLIGNEERLMVVIGRILRLDFNAIISKLRFEKYR